MAIIFCQRRQDELAEQFGTHHRPVVAGVIVAQDDDLRAGLDGALDDPHVAAQHLLHRQLDQFRLGEQIHQHVVEAHQVGRPHERGAMVEEDGAFAFVARDEVGQLAEPVRRVGIGRRVGARVVQRRDRPAQRMRHRLGAGQVADAPFVGVGTVRVVAHLLEQRAAADAVHVEPIHAIGHIAAARHGGAGDFFIHDKLEHRHAVGLAEFQGGMDTFDGVHGVGCSLARCFAFTPRRWSRASAARRWNATCPSATRARRKGRRSRSCAGWASRSSPRAIC